MKLKWMSQIRAAAVIGLAAVTVTTPQAADDPALTVKTVAGVLRVAQVNGVQRLLLNNKPLTKTDQGRSSAVEADLLAIKKKFSLPGRDVVLVQENCSGSACEFSTLSLVTVPAQGKATVSGGMTADEDGQVDIKQIGETLEIATVTFEGRRKKTNRWVYSNGDVKEAR